MCNVAHTAVQRNAWSLSEITHLLHGSVHDMLCSLEISVRIPCRECLMESFIIQAKLKTLNQRKLVKVTTLMSYEANTNFPISSFKVYIRMMSTSYAAAKYLLPENT